ncbi:MAG: isochorismate synthase [Polyangiales bacterium]
MLVSLTMPTAVIAKEKFIALELPAPTNPRELIFWDDPRHRANSEEAPPKERGEGKGEDWAFVGRGVAARVEARGSARMSVLRDRGDALLSGIVDEVSCRGAPLHRLFGGLSFAQGLRSEAWRGFDDASFILPRWAYAVRGQSAVMRLVISEQEFRVRSAELGRELFTVGEAIERVGSAKGAASEVSEKSSVIRSDCAYDCADLRFNQLVSEALAAIRARHLRKIVATRRSHMQLGASLDLERVLSRIARFEPTAVRFAFERGGAVFLGAAPERLVSMMEHRAETDALAGSSSRLVDPDGVALLTSEKDLREHAIVVDGIREALQPLSVSLEMDKAPQLRSLYAIHHLCTPIRATLSPSTHVIDVVAALHPTPAVSGFPKDRACAWIASHEDSARGWYASPVGWFDGSGNGSFAVAIRSALIRDRSAVIFVGAGIVEGSDPSREYTETNLKQTVMRTALGDG